MELDALGEVSIVELLSETVSGGDGGTVLG